MENLTNLTLSKVVSYSLARQHDGLNYKQSLFLYFCRHIKDPVTFSHLANVLNANNDLFDVHSVYMYRRKVLKYAPLDIIKTLDSLTPPSLRIRTYDPIIAYNPNDDVVSYIAHTHFKDVSSVCLNTGNVSRLYRLYPDFRPIPQDEIYHLRAFVLDENKLHISITEQEKDKLVASGWKHYPYIVYNASQGIVSDDWEDLRRINLDVSPDVILRRLVTIYSKSAVVDYIRRKGVYNFFHNIFNSRSPSTISVDVMDVVDVFIDKISPYDKYLRLLSSRPSADFVLDDNKIQLHVDHRTRNRLWQNLRHLTPLDISRLLNSNQDIVRDLAYQALWEKGIKAEEHHVRRPMYLVLNDKSLIDDTLKRMEYISESQVLSSMYRMRCDPYIIEYVKDVLSRSRTYYTPGLNTYNVYKSCRDL
jgi:hypothetical protein